MKKINLGAGNLIIDGYENHDIGKHRPEIMHSFDLNIFPYPLDDNIYDEVRMHDVLEHLDEPLKIIDEIHRILKPNGLLHMRVAGWKSEHCWDDLTHKRVYGLGAFDCLDPSTERGKEYSYYTTRKWHIDKKDWDRCNSIIIWMRTIK